MFSLGMNHTSLSSDSINESGFVGCQENGTCVIAMWKCGGGKLWGCFSGAGLSPLVPIKRTVNASAYQDIWDKFMLPTCGNSLGMDPSCSSMTVHQDINVLLGEWTEIPINTQLVETLPRRVEAVTPHGLRIGFWGSHTFEGRWVSAFGDIVL